MAREWRPSSSAVRAPVSYDHYMERKEEVIPPLPVVSDAVTIVHVRPATSAVFDVTVTTVPCSADTTGLLSLHQNEL